MLVGGGGAEDGKEVVLVGGCEAQWLTRWLVIGHVKEEMAEKVASMGEGTTPLECGARGEDDGEGEVVAVMFGLQERGSGRERRLRVRVRIRIRVI